MTTSRPSSRPASSSDLSLLGEHDRALKSNPREALVSDALKFGEQVGDFLRGLLQLAGPDLVKPAEAASAKKWVVVDANNISTGTIASLEFDASGACLRSDGGFPTVCRLSDVQ
jgi:hypothetical protein